MIYTKLGGTGLVVSKISFGGIPIQKIEREKMGAIIDSLIEHGINYIDTARAYTVSESYIGSAIKGRREKFILATKTIARDYEGAKRDIGISLEQLDTDYIDLYQFHNPSPAQLDTILKKGGALEALLEAKAEGKIRHIGITAHSFEVFRRALDLDVMETVMFPLNLVETRGLELLPLCRERNKGFIAMKPFAGGALPNAELALRWLLNQEGMDVAIPGMYCAEEIDKNCALIDGELAPISPEENAEIEATRQGMGKNFCRRCGYCAPCPQGIDVQTMLLLKGYLDNYGLVDWATTRYNNAAAKASDCVSCGLCESRCPYELPIRELLKGVVKSFEK